MSASLLSFGIQPCGIRVFFKVKVPIDARIYLQAFYLVPLVYNEVSSHIGQNGSLQKVHK